MVKQIILIDQRKKKKKKNILRVRIRDEVHRP